MKGEEKRDTHENKGKTLGRKNRREGDGEEEKVKNVRVGRTEGNGRGTGKLS